jgi:hypothetical protein
MIKDIVDAVLITVIDEDMHALQNRMQKLQNKKRDVMAKANVPKASPARKIISKDRSSEVDAAIKTTQDRMTIEQQKQRVKGESIYDRNTNLQGINEKVQTDMQKITELDGTTKTGSIFERVHDTMKGTI